MLNWFHFSKTPRVHTDVMTADQLIELRCLVWPQILFPDPPPLLPEWVNHTCWEEIHPLKTWVKVKQICTLGQLINEYSCLDHPTCLQKHSGTNMIAHHCPGCWGCWLRWPLYPLSNFSVSDFWHDLWATFDMQSADTEWLLCLWHLTWSLGHIWYAICWHSCGQSTAERLAVSQGLDINTLEKVPFKYSNFKSWEYWKIICFLKWNSVKCCLVKLCRATHHLKCPKIPYRNRSTRMARVTDVYKPVCPRNI